MIHSYHFIEFRRDDKSQKRNDKRCVSGDLANFVKNLNANTVFGLSIGKVQDTAVALTAVAPTLFSCTVFEIHAILMQMIYFISK